MASRRDYLSYETGPLNHLGDDLLRATVPAYLHQFREREDLPEGGANSILQFPLTTYHANGRECEVFWFNFDRADWNFEFGGVPITDPQIVEDILHSQFFDINVLSQELAGRNQPYPLPLYTKIKICQTGNYFLQHGIVVGYQSQRLRVLTADGSITSVVQNNAKLLDPENTLPFGIPCV